MSSGRTHPTRFLITIDQEYTRALVERGLVSPKSDGRLDGISRAVNKSLKDYLGRI
jgi:hypothetical protein